METHPIDPVALVSGLLFGLGGLAIFADQHWDDVDVAAFTGAGVIVIALLLAGLVVVRYLRLADEPEPVDLYAGRTETEPAPPVVEPGTDDTLQ